MTAFQQPGRTGITRPPGSYTIPWWLLLPQGVSGAIKRRAGYEPFRELARHGPITLGDAVQTVAGRLPFRAIIHVAGNANPLPNPTPFS